MMQWELKGNREGCSEGINAGWLEMEGTKEVDDDGIIVVKVFTSFTLKTPPSSINLSPTLNFQCPQPKVQQTPK